jgi:isopentenyl-diphosphate delta-isomerase
MNDMPQGGLPQNIKEPPAAGLGVEPQSAGSAGHKSLLPSSRTGERKLEHVRLCLNEEVGGSGITTGFEHYRFRHNALPELNFEDISLRTSFLGRELDTPLLISSMTGGSKATGAINDRLAAAAERRGWALGVGSVRAAVERSELAETFQVRSKAPGIPVIANIGAVQLSYGFGVEECRRAVEIAGADWLVLHLNGLQEVFQPEGNTGFASLLGQIEKVCRMLEVPVGIKEVGWGIDGDTAMRLYNAGAAFIDVAGAGGTSWSQVEKFRSADPVRRAAAEAFADWGIPTAECIAEVRAASPQGGLIGSGGLKHGVDAAKALALGADLAGFGRNLLGPAVESEEALDRALAQVELELRTAMFGIGAPDLAALRGSPRLVRR